MSALLLLGVGGGVVVVGADYILWEDSGTDGILWEDSGSDVILWE